MNFPARLHFFLILKPRHRENNLDKTQVLNKTCCAIFSNRDSVPDKRIRSDEEREPGHRGKVNQNPEEISEMEKL